MSHSSSLAGEAFGKELGHFWAAELSASRTECGSNVCCAPRKDEKLVRKVENGSKLETKKSLKIELKIRA